MKEILIKILKVYGIYALVAVVLTVLFRFWGSTGDVYADLMAIGFTLLLPILFIIVFSPAILGLWLLFKKVKSPNWRMALIILLIPLTNLIYFFIEGQLIRPTETPIVSMIIGGAVLFHLLPLLFITACIVPKTINSFKIRSILTIMFTFIFGMIMIFIGLPIAQFVLNNITPNIKFTYYSPSTTRELDKYNPMIQYIEDYKAQNGKYPSNVDEIKVDSGKYSFYEYKTFNNEQDFVLYVNSPKHGFDDGFRYCSSKTLPDCDVGYDKEGNTHKRVGKWIHMYYEM